MSKCEICSKDVNFSVQSSHSNRKTARTWSPNLQKVRVPAGGNTTRKMTVCTRCLKSDKVIRAV